MLHYLYCICPEHVVKNYDLNAEVREVFAQRVGGFKGGVTLHLQVTGGAVCQFAPANF